MPDMKIKCPYCNEGLDAPLELIGLDVECPTCSNSFKVQMQHNVQQCETASKVLPKKRIFINHQPRTLVPPSNTVKQYEGIKREPFWFILFGGSALTYAVATWMGGHFLDIQFFVDRNLNPLGGIIVWGFVPIMWLILVVWVHDRRMLNIMGTKGVWGLLVFIPVINVGVLFMCLFFPTGWNDTRKLDIKTWLLILLAIFIGICFYHHPIEG